MPDGFLTVEGDLDKLKADLRATARDLGRAQRAGMKEVATDVADWAQSDARSGTPQQRHFAAAIRPGATQDTAKLRIADTAKALRGATGAFWGALAWHQFPDWAGTSWETGQLGQGPQPLNNTIGSRWPQIEDRLAAAYEGAFAHTFPGGFD